MVAVTELSSVITEFAGTNRVNVVKVTGVAAARVLTVDELSTLSHVQTCPISPDGAATDMLVVACSAMSTNTATFIGHDSGGIAATGGACDFYVLAIGS